MVAGELSRMPDEILDTSITSIAGGGGGATGFENRFYSYFTLVNRSPFVRKMHRSTKFYRWSIKFIIKSN